VILLFKNSTGTEDFNAKGGKNDVSPKNFTFDQFFCFCSYFDGWPWHSAAPDRGKSSGRATPYGLSGRFEI
jgi:hypothetical protein